MRLRREGRYFPAAAATVLRNELLHPAADQPDDAITVPSARDTARAALTRGARRPAYFAAAPFQL